MYVYMFEKNAGTFPSNWSNIREHVFEHIVVQLRTYSPPLFRTPLRTPFVAVPPSRPHHTMAKHMFGVGVPRSRTELRRVRYS